MAPGSQPIVSSLCSRCRAAARLISVSFSLCFSVSLTLSSSALLHSSAGPPLPEQLVLAAYYLAEILMFIYKGVSLPYPSDNLVLDVALLVIFLGLETLRIFYGWKGNLCERSLASCVSIFILFPCVALAVYYLLLQTFVLRLEFILSGVLLCFYGLELLLGLLSVSAFSRSKVY
ncbi:hypothetical protein INR49_019050 [Caranx melampygus]|nr:hypothetical protein INR49_019050 [Caranx melampygus]